MIIFDGEATAEQRQDALRQRVESLAQRGISLKIAAVLYTEDQGSTLYTHLKQSAAQEVGIEYELSRFSLAADTDQVLANIDQLNQDPTVTGIIIQKPRRSTWQKVVGAGSQAPVGESTASTTSTRRDFAEWWRLQTTRLNPAKDVDGLHPETLRAIETGTWQERGLVMPATVRAVLSILDEAQRQLPSFRLDQRKVVILGRSELLGRPLHAHLRRQGIDTELLGKADLTDRLDQGRGLTDAGVVVAATGQRHLVTGQMLSPGVVLIDVGEPRPDVDLESVGDKATFVTPVPGGVGPMTVVSLLENCVTLALSRRCLKFSAS